jgi:hypothetical protein
MNSEVLTYKLFMVLLGCRPPGRHVEQHDIFFGIAPSLKELIPGINQFWPEAANRIHIDAWREVTVVEGYKISIEPRPLLIQPDKGKRKLFFINLGGYQHNKFEEQHYMLLTVKENKNAAMKEGKSTLFFQQNHISGGASHIDDKYGIDIDDLYEIEELLINSQKEKFTINLVAMEGLQGDGIHLGYLKISTIN